MVFSTRELIRLSRSPELICQRKTSVDQFVQGCEICDRAITNGEIYYELRRCICVPICIHKFCLYKELQESFELIKERLSEYGPQVKEDKGR